MKITFNKFFNANSRRTRPIVQFKLEDNRFACMYMSQFNRLVELYGLKQEYEHDFHMTKIDNMLKLDKPKGRKRKLKPLYVVRYKDGGLGEVTVNKDRLNRHVARCDDGRTVVEFPRTFEGTLETQLPKYNDGYIPLIDDQGRFHKMQIVTYMNMLQQNNNNPKFKGTFTYLHIGGGALCIRPEKLEKVVE